MVVSCKMDTMGHKGCIGTEVPEMEVREESNSSEQCLKVLSSWDRMGQDGVDGSGWEQMLADGGEGMNVGEGIQGVRSVEVTG